MHESVLRWAKQKVDEHNLSGLSVLEVGSLDVNGSVRGFFSGDYIGIDMRPGSGVDVVENAHHLSFPSNSFDAVVCTEMLEHDSEPWSTLLQIGRVLRPDGWLLLTARGFGFPQHDFPSDYWRFTVGAFESLFQLASITPVEIIPDTDENQPGVFGLGRKAV